MTRLSNETVQRLREVATLPALPPGRYEITGPIGRGGMGAVYAARDVLLGRAVAIKVSNAVVAESDLDVRLRREARVLATLEHPGIVPVHDAGLLEDGRLFYVMKLVHGQTLGAHAATLTTEAARLAVFERVVDAVAFAHEAGVVHRDLKPSNIMVGRFGEVLILDWGAALILDDARLAVVATPGGVTPAHGTGPGQASQAVSTATDTRTGTILGTPGFMAPEQARGDVHVSPCADVHALGALLFWMFTNETPGPDSEANRGRLRGAAAPPARRLDSILWRCLSPDPADRYARAGDLAADLTRYRADQAVQAHEEHALERLARALKPYRAFIVLVIAYLVMRTVFALWMSRG